LWIPTIDFNALMRYTAKKRERGTAMSKRSGLFFGFIGGFSFSRFFRHAENRPPVR